MDTPKSILLELAAKLQGFELKLENLAASENDQTARVLLNYTAQNLNDVGVRLLFDPSSARTRIDRGTASPSALAVLAFTTISNFVGSCTGRSPAFSPRRMRST